jgi:hypothetical protein
MRPAKGSDPFFNGLFCGGDFEGHMEETPFYLGGGFFCVFALIGLALLAFWIWMLIDCIKNEPSTGNDKLIWVLVIVFLGWIGAAIYFFVRRPSRLSSSD